MANQAASIATAFAALADPTRRQIFERIAEQERSVGELADGLPVSRPAVSQHLQVLRDAGLVSHEQDGTRRVYRIDPRGLAMMRGYLDRFWDRALAAFKAAAESEDPQPAQARGRTTETAKKRRRP
jgi:DNA-binding transcriptional ArsR family regulator